MAEALLLSASSNTEETSAQPPTTLCEALSPVAEAAEVTVAKVEASAREVMDPVVEEDAGTTLTDVSVTMGSEMIFPDGSLVTSLMLVTVLCVGPTVVTATSPDVVPNPPSMPRMPDAAAAVSVVELVDVEDDIVMLDVLDVVELVAETVTVEAVAETVVVEGVAETVTVCTDASAFTLSACGSMKFGAKLIEGFCSPGLQIAVAVPGPAQGKIRDGALLYRPMTVYAKRIVLSKARMTAKTMKSGMGIVTPDLRDRGGGP